MKTVGLKENSERLDLPCTDKDIFYFIAYVIQI